MTDVFYRPECIFHYCPDQIRCDKACVHPADPSVQATAPTLSHATKAEDDLRRTRMALREAFEALQVVGGYLGSRPGFTKSQAIVATTDALIACDLVLGRPPAHGAGAAREGANGG